MSENTTTPAEPNARRRLLRGVFSAPAIMTVCSGSAFAASSNAMCVANAQSGVNRTIPGVSDKLDGYLRVRLWGWQKSGGTPAKFYVFGTEVAAFKKTTNSSFLSGSQYQEFVISGNKTTGSVLASRPGAPDNTAGWSWTATNKYAVLRIDGSGNIVGVGTASTGSAIAGTCWNSFTGA